VIILALFAIPWYYFFMNGLTIREIVDKTNLKYSTVRMRLFRAGIKPVAYCGPVALYPESALEIVSGPRHRGPKPKARA
jgi:hypothetical protein